jgi:thiosulfate/3-mercaptopyruvate sulfurtransferase
MLSSIINADELLTLKGNNDLVLIDASNDVNANENYLKSHLSNAIFIDLNTQLSDIKEDVAFGGRHPLPSVENFCKLLGGIGISDSSHVVIYDNKYGANAAARLWWMLRSIGHDKVQVLNGGIKQAIMIGYPTSHEVISLSTVSAYNATHWILPISDIVEVEAVSQLPHQLVIDVREAPRYNGEIEPIDLIAGHIPGAINLPFVNNLDDKGCFLPAPILYQKYISIIGNIDPNKIIVHCGSGVTACHTLLAMDYAGLQIPKLYIGSWSEWSRRKPMYVAKTLQNNKLKDENS